jgi:drug/metabolite transporter (DMT)-like permease
VSAPFWVWVLVAFGVAAAWGLTVVVNKRTLHYVDPFALNMVVRVPTIALLAVVGTALTATGAWDLGFGMTWAAFGYITVSAVVTWLVAFNCYYLVLRLGELGVVTPIMATDPLFTAVFAVLLLGSSLGPLVITGLAVSTLGILLLSRWMEAGGDASAAGGAGDGVLSRVSPPAAGDRAAQLLALPAAGDGVLQPAPGAGAPAPAAAFTTAAGKSSARVRLEVIGLALVTAAGWGLAPVVIEQATLSVGGASVTMMLQSQVMGFLLLLPIVWRRGRIAVRRLRPPERRYVIRLILATSVLETIFSVAFYVLIDEIGSVLTVLIIATSPVFAILGGMWLLGERYGWRLVIGGTVTLVGVAIATLQGM